jgi:hypothetical protein
VQSQTALPWHINKDYDYLVGSRPPRKERSLSWITSSLSNWHGRRARMDFLEHIRGEVEFDLLGRGFREIEDKWDGLASYRYSLAVENFRSPYYWTEKIADCYLSWTMPIYCGCTRITEYFPEESMLCIDIQDPAGSLERIREALSSDRWGRNLDAIAHARDLVLNKYQLFPFIVKEIRSQERRVPSRSAKKAPVTFSGYDRIPPPAGESAGSSCCAAIYPAKDFKGR